MSHKKSVGGKYIARSHTTAIALASRVAKMLSESNLITKVTLRIINPKGGSQKKVTVIKEDYGLHLRVQESSGSQELYVSAPDRELVINCLETWCQREGIPCTLR